MTNLTGTNVLTYKAAANETIKITYGFNATVDIMNDTAGKLKVSNADTFTGTSFFVIGDGGSYNGYRPNAQNIMQNSAVLYLETAAAGDISVVVVN